MGRILTTPEYYAYLKIAEGCDNHCAYCVIPKLRGKLPQPPDGGAGRRRRSSWLPTASRS